MTEMDDDWMSPPRIVFQRRDHLYYSSPVKSHTSFWIMTCCYVSSSSILIFFLSNNSLSWSNRIHSPHETGEIFAIWTCRNWFTLGTSVVQLPCGGLIAEHLGGYESISVSEALELHIAINATSVGSVAGLLGQTHKNGNTSASGDDRVGSKAEANCLK